MSDKLKYDTDVIYVPHDMPELWPLKHWSGIMTSYTLMAIRKCKYVIMVGIVDEQRIRWPC